MRCGTEIKKRDPYIWWKFNYGAKHVRCAEPSCSPKPSELTRSFFWGQIHDLQKEGFAGSTFDDLRDRVAEVVDALNELAEDCEEKFNNMPESLQNGSTGELLTERAETLRNCVSALESIDIPEDNAPEPFDDDDEEESEELRLYEAKVDGVRDELESALSDIGCG
jgi:hypothetical protein